MADYTEHCRLSPSGSKGWFACPGKIQMEESIPDVPNPYADNGTAMHLVAASCLMLHTERAAQHIGVLIPVSREDEPLRQVLFDDEMAELVQGYVDTIIAIADVDKPVHIEQEVDFTRFVSEQSELAKPPGDGERQFGTADAMIHFRAEGELGVFDLKTGRTPVQVAHNSQLMIYGLGGLCMLLDTDPDTTLTDPFEYARAIGINSMRLGVYQPKVREGMQEWQCSLEDMADFANVLLTKAQKVDDATADFGKIPAEKWERMYLNPKPNEIECAFCRALPTCPAAARAVVESVGADFSVIADAPESISVPPKFQGTHADDDQELSFKMRSVGFIEDWCLAVRAETERRLLAGLQVPGFGLELGRKPARKWSEPEAAERLLIDRFKVTIREAFTLKLKSPTQLEALCDPKKNEKPVLGPRQWAKMQGLIAQGDASPSVKPAAIIKNPYVLPKPDASAFAAVDDPFGCDLV